MPVYSNLPLTYASLEIGGRIRRERTRRGWTLADLAKQFGVSVASLSAIENDKALLTVDRLLRVSQVLGVRPDALFSRTLTRPYQITRGSDMPEGKPPAIIDEARGPRTYENPLHPLAAPYVGKHIEPFEITMLPAPREDLPFISHHNEEFFCVLVGRVECLLDTPDGRIRERLGPGDCMYFRSHLPHCIRAVGRKAAHTLHVLCPALGATEIERTDGEVAPIYSGRADLDVRTQVAAKIRTLRLRLGMSLAEAAATFRISERRLLGIERGRRPVGLDLLLRICAAFRKPVEYFLAGALIGAPYYAVQRASGIPRLRPRVRRDGLSARTRPPRYIFRSLAGRFGARGMFPYYVKVPSGAAAVTTLHEHHGEEFVYVLNGQVTLVTLVEGSRVTETLSRGDSCFLDSTVPHRFIATAQGPYERSGAEVLAVLWCPLGEDYLFANDRAARTTAAPRQVAS
jgi:transcriptional regulator with XRE-family HTH domain/oxalate decarboxylase/phosphoglucose isomerase-like protein (cupin superfamily)